MKVYKLNIFNQLNFFLNEEICITDKAKVMGESSLQFTCLVYC